MFRDAAGTQGWWRDRGPLHELTPMPPHPLRLSLHCWDAGPIYVRRALLRQYCRLELYERHESIDSAVYSSSIG